MVQMTRSASQLQFIDEAIYTPIVTQRQISSKQTVQKNGRIPRSKLVDVHAATQREVPTVHKVETTVGGPKMQFVNEVETRKTPGRPQLRDETVESGQGHSTGTSETRRKESFSARTCQTV